MTEKPNTRKKRNSVMVAVTKTLGEITDVVNLAETQVAADVSLCVTSMKTKFIQQKYLIQILNDLSINYRFVVKMNLEISNET